MKVEEGLFEGMIPVKLEGSMQMEQNIPIRPFR